MENKEKNFISAVIYVHNSGSAIRSFILKISEMLNDRFEHSEIICVNDASDDDSVNAIRETAKELGDISLTLLHLPGFHGKEAAMQGGVGLSIGDYVFEFDEPFSELDPDDVISIYNKAMEGYDIVAAVGEGGTRTSSRMFYRIFNRFADLSYPLETEEYRCISRRAINRIRNQNKFIVYRKVAYATCGLNYTSVKVNNYRRTNENAKQKKARRSLAVDSLIMFTDIGFTFSLIMTITMMILMIATAVYALISKIIGVTIYGWTSTVLLIAFGFFGIFGILTIITKYLQLLINLNVKRQAVTFNNIEKIN